MFQFKSIKSRFLFISFFIIFIVATFSYQSFLLIKHIEGDATRINIAGQLRYRSFEIAWFLNKIFIKGTSEKDSYFVDELEREIELFEDTLKVIEYGDEEDKLRPYPHIEGLQLFKVFRDNWRNRTKPLLNEIRSAPTEDAHRLLDAYNTELHDSVYKINAFVSFMEKNYNAKISEHQRQTLYLLLFFLTGSLISYYFFIRRGVLSPLKMLMKSVSAIEKGDFSVRAQSMTQDEFGRLSDSFNKMAKTLDITFNEKTRLLEKLESLASFPEKNPYPIFECDMDYNINLS